MLGGFSMNLGGTSAGFGAMMKRGYHQPHAQWAMTPYNSQKQFPDFKANPCTTNNPTVVCSYRSTVRDNSEDEANSSQVKAQSYVSFPCSGRSRRRRLRRKRIKQNKSGKCADRKVKEFQSQQQQCDNGLVAILPRERQVSITDSEDDFVIVFDDGSTEGIESEHDNVQSDDDSESSDYETINETASSSESIAPKRVRFADDDSLCEVHVLSLWSCDYEESRKGPWEEYARDRARFQRRIEQTESQLAAVLTKEHRLRIFRERFSE